MLFRIGWDESKQNHFGLNTCAQQWWYARLKVVLELAEYARVGRQTFVVETGHVLPTRPIFIECQQPTNSQNLDMHKLIFCQRVLFPGLGYYPQKDKDLSRCWRQHTYRPILYISRCKYIDYSDYSPVLEITDLY